MAVKVLSDYHAPNYHFIAPDKLYFTTRLGFKLRETIGIEQVNMDTVLIFFSASEYNYYQLRNVIEKFTSGVHISCRRVPEPECWHSQFRLEMSCDRDYCGIQTL